MCQFHIYLNYTQKGLFLIIVSILYVFLHLLFGTFCYVCYCFKLYKTNWDEFHEFLFEVMFVSQFGVVIVMLKI